MQSCDILIQPYFRAAAVLVFATCVALFFVRGGEGTQELVWLMTKRATQFTDTSLINLLVPALSSCASSGAFNYFYHKTIFGKLMPDRMVIRHQGIFQRLKVITFSAFGIFKNRPNNRNNPTSNANSYKTGSSY